jgi:hypothetical protein
LEARIRAEVDRAVAPYEGIAPPFVIAKMRELAERYWRESPVAYRVLRMQTQKEIQVRSGEQAVLPEDVQTGPGEVAGGKKV